MRNYLDFCRHLPEMSVAAGDYLIRENEKEGRMFFLKSGTVDILKNDSVINTLIGVGALIGEVSALLNRPPLASVRATSDCVFHVCEDPQKLLDENPEIALKIGRTLAARLYSVTNQLAEIDKQNKSEQLTFLSPVMESLYHQQSSEENGDTAKK